MPQTAARTVAGRCPPHDLHGVVRCKTGERDPAAGRDQLLAAAIGIALDDTAVKDALSRCRIDRACDSSVRGAAGRRSRRRCGHRRTTRRRKRAASQLCHGMPRRSPAAQVTLGSVAPERYGPIPSCSRPSSIPGTAIGAASARCRSKISQCTIGRGPFPEIVADGDGQQPARADGAHRRQEPAAGLELVGHPGVLQPGDLSLMTRRVDADREHLGRSVDHLQAQEDGLVGRGDRLLGRRRRLRRAGARDRDERRADGRRRAGWWRGPAADRPDRAQRAHRDHATSIDLPTDRCAR